MEGTPLRRSVVYRTTKENADPPNSARYTPPRNPIGTPMQVAISSSLALPTIALAMPPPGSPTGVGSLVKKSTVRLLPPWTNRYPRIKRSVPTATNVHTPVRLSMTAFTAFRRKLNIPELLPPWLAGPLLGRAENQHARQSVNDNRQPE